MSPEVLKEIQALHRLGYGLGRIGSLSEVLQAAADAVAGLLPADRVAIIEMDLPGQRVGHFVRGGPGALQIETTISFAELLSGLTGWVLKTGGPALSPRDAFDERESPDAQRRRKKTNCGSIIVVPLTFDGTVQGTMTAINSLDQREFTQDDVSVLVLFAHYCSVVIGNAKLILELKHAMGLADLANHALTTEVETKNRLFAILAHDLRGPLGNLATLLRLLALEAGETTELRHNLEEAEKSAQRTFGLLDNLLGWIRGQMKGAAQRTSVVVGQTLSSVRQSLEPQATAKGVTIDLEVPGTLMQQVYEGMFETIIRNLVSNAIKYSPAGSRIVLRARSEDGNLVVEVIDEGEGMTDDKLQRLFGTQRVDSKPGTAGERGTGLGLMFSADLARGLGGNLEATSAPQMGSTFRLVLPELVR